MMRWGYLILSAAFLAGVLLSIAIAQSDVVTIENKYGKRLKSPVTLSHKKHADTITCTQCHHEWKKE